MLAALILNLSMTGVAAGTGDVTLSFYERERGGPGDELEKMEKVRIDDDELILILKCWTKLN